MKFFVVIGMVCLAAFTVANPDFEVVENEDGELFRVLPLNRVRRDNSEGDVFNTGKVYGSVDITDPGRVFLGAKHTPINTNDHVLKTHVFATDNVRHSSPLTVGGEASYLYKPSGSTLDVSATRTERMGTDLSVSGKYNFFQGKATKANVEGFMSKHWKRLPGNEATDYGVVISVDRTF